MPLNRSLKGKEYQEVTFEVTRPEVVAFAEAIGEGNPIYRDAEAAKPAGYPEKPWRWWRHGWRWRCGGPCAACGALRA